MCVSLAFRIFRDFDSATRYIWSGTASSVLGVDLWLDPMPQAQPVHASFFEDHMRIIFIVVSFTTLLRFGFVTTRTTTWLRLQDMRNIS